MQQNTGSHNRIRGLHLRAAVALAVSAGVILGASAAEAQTPPASYYGVATGGDTIEAKYNGITCSTATAGADGFWSLRVSGGGACGIADGGTLSFFRNGADSGAVETFKAGGVPASISGGVNTGGGAIKPAPAPPSIPAPSTFSGAAPAVGGSALLVTTRESTPEALKIALGSTGCQVQSLAVLREGQWMVYIEGAPAAVNGAFPAALPQTSPFFARC